MPRLFGKFEIILACSVIISAIFISVFIPSLVKPLISPIPPIPPTSQITLITPTPAWNTYTDSQYHFTLQYPTNWTYSEKPLVLESPLKNNTTIPEYTINIDIRKKVLKSFEEIASKSGESCVGSCPEEGGELKTESKDYHWEKPVIEKKSINNHMIYYITDYYQTPLIIIPLPNSDREYLEIRPGHWSKDGNYLLFDRILSTFKFLD